MPHLEKIPLPPPNGIALCEQLLAIRGLPTELVSRMLGDSEVAEHIEKWGWTVAQCGVVACEAVCILNSSTENHRLVVQPSTLSNESSCRRK